MSRQDAIASRAAFACFAEEHIVDEDYLDESRTPEQILQVGRFLRPPAACRLPPAACPRP